MPEHDSLTVTTSGLVLLALSEKVQVIGNGPSAATGLGTAATSHAPPMSNASAIVLFDIRPYPPRSCRAENHLAEASALGVWH